ncbi:substrate-binding domain-containing protein [Microbacterium radiodurans]|uniref:DeoR family transcriptional regulator n=1 Tax=Microbacterium radiodurans TaxID=661398 RepID=A0A5J5IP94_9MICO|nr:substrate-binding domain-containing protein [Microbacterium radiodurans]KAA9085453.1 DeoR family transcriptional regulator [Microbacterium radiodurans]
MTASSPLARERHEHLLREIDLHGAVSAARAAAALGVSQVTVRRDIVELEQAGRLVRVHGGAIASSAPPSPQSARSRIGVVVPSSVSHFPPIVRGMDAASHTLRARIVLATSQYRADLEQRQVERLVALGVDGIIVAPTLRGRAETDLAEWAAGVPVPLVFLERRLESTALAAFDCARSDHERGAVLAIEHLADLGHSAVALAMFDRTPTAPLIREGYDRAAARLGLAPAPIASLPKGDDGSSELDTALTAFLEQCLSAGARAALVHTDLHATRLVEIAADRGIRVPDDLALVAYDDDLAGLAMVPLTAVTAPRHDLGRQALRIVMERVAEREERAAPRQLALLPELTVRRSSGSR